MSTNLTVRLNLFKEKRTSICAGAGPEGDTKGRDTCRGDSGGPLFGMIKQNNKYKFALFGITSRGGRCIETGGSGSVYVNIVPYLYWINKNTN